MHTYFTYLNLNSLTLWSTHIHISNTLVIVRTTREMDKYAFSCQHKLFFIHLVIFSQNFHTNLNFRNPNVAFVFSFNSPSHTHIQQHELRADFPSPRTIYKFNGFALYVGKYIDFCKVAVWMIV